MSRSPVRFGLVGYGAWGRHHAQAIAQHPEAELVAIATPSETSRAAAANAHPDARIFGGHAHGNSRDPQRPQLFDNFSAMFR
ncbi:MAG: Gfo/Idh/MocA family oxidoreductase, partial [Opitutaceae bacterium]